MTKLDPYPYPISTTKDDYRNNDHYAIKLRGQGGRIVGTDMKLTRDQAEAVGELMERAFQLGLEANVDV